MSTQHPYSNRIIQVDLSRQHLQLLEADRLIFEAPVSTARNGPGEKTGSECTPRGWHRIRIRIGEGCPINTVFSARRSTGEIYTPELGAREPERDWILTRILWLSGMERGRNRMGAVDTLRRYIYIHGTPDDSPMGVPGSHGCIRMHNEALITLFEQVTVGTRVLIQE